MAGMRPCCLALMASTTLWATDAPAQTATFHTRPGSTAPFSPAVRAGDILYVSGQIGVAQDGTVPPAMADQAKLAMENVRGALTLAGASFADVVKCTVMLTDMRQWAEFNRVYLTYFTPGHYPARSAMGATALAFGAGVEVECIAFQPRKPAR